MSLLRHLFICAFVVSTLDAQWIPTNGPLEGVTLSLALGVDAAGDTTLYAGARTGWVFKTTNNGDSWTEIDGGTWWGSIDDTGFTKKDIRLLAASPNGKGGICLFAVNAKGRIYRSFNADTNWTSISNDINNHPVNTLVISDTNIFVGTDSGVFRSTDLGSNWIKFNNELTPYAVYSLALASNGTGGSTLFVTTSGGIYRSTNDGVNWIAVYTNPDEVMDYYNLVVGLNAIGGMNLYMLRSGIRDIFCSIDSGVTWTVLNPLDPYTNITVTNLAIHDTIIYAGTDGYGMYYSFDYGTKWVNGNTYNSPRGIHALLVVEPNLFIGVSSAIGYLNSVWYRPLSEMVTNVKDEDKRNLSTFTLEQNYPNPFNPRTKIGFEIKISGLVVLKIYDVLGRAIETLLDERKSSGSYEIEWEAKDIPSGVYFYRLTSGTFTQTKKMVLIK